MDRCSEGVQPLRPLKGPSDPTYVESGHIALPPRGSKRLGPQCWWRLVRLAEAQKFWSTGGEAGPEEDCVTDYE